MQVPPIDPHARGRAPRYRLWCSWCTASLASARLRDCEARRETTRPVVLNATVEIRDDAPLALAGGIVSGTLSLPPNYHGAPTRNEPRARSPLHGASILGRSTRHSRVARQWETVAPRLERGRRRARPVRHHGMGRDHALGPRPIQRITGRSGFESPLRPGSRLDCPRLFASGPHGITRRIHPPAQNSRVRASLGRYDDRRTKSFTLASKRWNSILARRPVSGWTRAQPSAFARDRTRRCAHEKRRKNAP
jgi:hypothetical protein